MTKIDYIGSELELFLHADNWKKYWSGQVSPYIGSYVFDVGAGLGANIPILHRPGMRWLAIEPDPELARRSHIVMAEKGLGDLGEVHVGTLADIDYAKKADTIIYIDVLEHIDDDRAEMQLAMRHLHPGGHLIVLAPAHQWLFTSFDTAVGHFRRYTRKTLSDIAPEGLKLKRMRYLDSFGLLASAGNKLVLKSANPSPSQIAFWDNVLVPPSRLADRLFYFKVGKTILGIWQLPKG